MGGGAGREAAGKVLWGGQEALGVGWCAPTRSLAWLHDMTWGPDTHRLRLRAAPSAIITACLHPVSPHLLVNPCLACLLRLTPPHPTPIPTRPRTPQVWVTGIPHEWDRAAILEYWGYCGPLEEEALHLLTFKDSGNFNGTAFITFKTQVEGRQGGRVGGCRGGGVGGWAWWVGLVGGGKWVWGFGGAQGWGCFIAIPRNPEPEWGWSCGPEYRRWIAASCTAMQWRIYGGNKYRAARSRRDWVTSP